MVSGRWHTQKSARIYINEGLALLTQMSISVSSPHLRPFFKVYQQVSQTPLFTTLEPPTKGGRSGGRGNRKRLGRKQRKKSAFSVICRYFLNILLHFLHFDDEEVWLGTSSEDLNFTFKVWGLARHLKKVLPGDRDSRVFILSCFSFLIF